MTQKSADNEALRRLLGPSRPELSCEECFVELDRYVELHVLPGMRARFEVCAPCKTPSECARERDCLGMRAHLEGCPACGEEHESLRTLVAEEMR